MTARRILLASTPVGPLGSGIGGGVELTLHNLVYGLSMRGHHVEVVAPAGSLQVGERVHQVHGALQTSSQLHGRRAPVEMPPGSVLAQMWRIVGDIGAGFDVVINLAYDWLPFYLTPLLSARLVHLVSMGSLNDVMDHAIGDVHRWQPGRLAAHSSAQAQTFGDSSMFNIVGNGIVAERYDVRTVVEADAPLGFVGRISPEKGLEDVAALSARTGRPVQVWGMMQDHAYWDRIVADYPEARLEYRGFLPTDELQGHVGRCSALVMTPKWIEAFGNVAVEAMATGVPVITYDRGGPAEIVVDGVTGFVVPADDVAALQAAVGRIGEIDRLECRRRVDDEYSSMAMADRVVTWIDGAVDSATDPAPAALDV